MTVNESIYNKPTTELSSTGIEPRTVESSSIEQTAIFAPYDLDGRPLPLVGGQREQPADADKNESLPLLIYLKGTESYFEDFCLEADEVMQILGIKRSRLTQISGKELRVGRVRRGRYISPVYREVDVMEYLNWSRATATQSKNAAILHDAAQTMLDEASRLNGQLSQLLQSSLKKQQEDLSKQLHQFSTQIIKQAVEVTSTQHTALQNALRDQGEQLKRAIFKLHDDLSSISQKLHQELATQKSSITTFHSAIAETMQQLMTKLLVSEDRMQLMQEQNLELATQLQTLSQRLDVQLQQTSGNMNFKHRRPGRVSPKTLRCQAERNLVTKKEPPLAKIARRIKAKVKAR